MLTHNFKKDLFFSKFDLDNFLNNFFTVMPFPMHLKEASSGKYISMNHYSAYQFGFGSPEQAAGLTINDLDPIMKGHWHSNFSQEIFSLDKKATSIKEPISHKHVFLNYSGFVLIENMIKIPILTKSKKVHSIVTIGEDLTKTSGSYELFLQYRNFYKNKKAAIEKFLKYLLIDQLFHEMPTEAELRMLLAMKKNDSYKALAYCLDISLKTVEIHRKNLKEKIKTNLDYVLCALR